MISDSEMQLIWSIILANETNSPGAYTKRTLTLLSELEKSDATLFTYLCKFNFRMQKNQIMIFDPQDKIYEKYGVTFNSLTHLDSIGLIQFEFAQDFLRLRLPKTIYVDYFGKVIRVTFNQEENNQITVGKVLLSQSGQELSRICDALPEEDIFNFTIEKWKKDGHEIEII